MKKFFTALLALILALAMVFTLAACQPSDPNTGDDGGKEETLQPVDAKTFVKALLNNVTDELAVKWIATVDGETSVTAKDAEAVIAPVDVNESGRQSLAEYVQYFKNAINVLDEFDSLLTGTVPVAEDKSGYELSLEADLTDGIMAILNMATGYLIANQEAYLGDLLASLFFGGSYEDGAGLVPLAEWTASIFNADITFAELFEKIEAALTDTGISAEKIVNIITTVIGIDITYAQIKQMLGTTPVTAVVTPLLQSIEGFEQMKYEDLGDLVLLGGSLQIKVLWDQILAPMLAGSNLPFVPTLDVLATISVTKADLEITIKADKDMKLTDIEVSCAFNGSITAADGTVYAANITDATFGCAVEYGAA